MFVLDACVESCIEPLQSGLLQTHHSLDQPAVISHVTTILYGLTALRALGYLYEFDVILTVHLR